MCAKPFALQLSFLHFAYKRDFARSAGMSTEDIRRQSYEASTDNEVGYERLCLRLRVLLLMQRCIFSFLQGSARFLLRVIQFE